MFKAKKTGIVLSSFFLALLINCSIVSAGGSDTYFKISGMLFKAENQSTPDSVAVPSVDLKSDLGPGVAVAVGTKLGSRYRAELEYSYRTFDYEIDKSNGEKLAEAENETHAVMANILYDLRRINGLSPYIGFGIGADWENGKIKSGVAKGIEVSSKTEFAYQILVGANYELTEYLDAVLGYRYWGANHHQKDTKTHNLELGIVYYF